MPLSQPLLSSARWWACAAACALAAAIAGCAGSPVIKADAQGGVQGAADAQKAEPPPAGGESPSRTPTHGLRPLQKKPPTPADAPASEVAPVILEPSDNQAEESFDPAAVQPGEFARGGASWYGLRFNHRRTASGERFDMGAFTAAHRTLPFGTLVCVRSLSSGKTVMVRINDRGPYASGRIIDLSQAAAEALDMVGTGIKQVALSLPLPDRDDCSRP